MFLPHLRDDEPGTRLTNLEYAPLAEIMGRLPWASEVFNCSAPDTGNMEILHMFGTPEQKAQWLAPLMNGEIRSCFAMTEPDVASSDATNVTTSIRRVGDEYVINGRKWFITNAARPDCMICIVMGKTDPEAETHRQQSMVLVPMDTPGLNVVRDLHAMHHESHETHGEVVFRDVRVPVSNVLGEEGSGFAIAQARLGPGRIHHCMRSIGQAELALEMMIERARERKTFGKYLVDQGVVQEMIARSRYGDRTGPASGAQGRLDDRSLRRQGRAQRNRHDQGRDPANADLRHRPRDAGLRRHGTVSGHPAARIVDHGARVAPGGRTRRGSSPLDFQGRVQENEGQSLRYPSVLHAARPHFGNRYAFRDGHGGQMIGEAVLFPSRVAGAAEHLRDAERNCLRDADLEHGFASAVIIGGGLMGRGIALALALAGLRVHVTDTRQEAADAAKAAIERDIARLEDRGRLKAPAKDLAAQISYETDLSAVAVADLVIEAVFEDMTLKQEIFTACEALARTDAVLASNTSTLDIDAIASVGRHPGRVIGTHFFLPAHSNKLLELVPEEERRIHRSPLV